MKVLSLTSPNIKGAEVAVAQSVLKDRGYYNGKMDSVYGQQTAAAAKAAKWDLGYRKKNVTSTFGGTLLKFLLGKRKPTLLMRRRASIRHNKSTVGNKALDVASSYIGVSEKPARSNQVMFSTWYGMIGPWCLMFVTYCFVKSGSKSFIKGSKYAYCPYLLADAKASRNGLRIIPTTAARTGDIVLFDFKKNGVAAHVGIVNVAPNKRKTFTSVEGNTSGTNPSDGGMVALMERNVADVIAFVRVTN
tara:strand:- start:1699 stop:2439 length:741 start_codon:yes stop_codon:yes gene_type:complete